MPIHEEGEPKVVPGVALEVFNVEEAMNDFPTMPEGAAPAMQRTDSQVDFPLQNKSISGGDPVVRTRFFARWKGRIRIGKPGGYSFHLAANDGARLSIDGHEVVQAIWRKVNGTSSQTAPLSAGEKTGTATLDAGDHELLLEFYNDTGRDGVALHWSFEGGVKAVIPPEVLFHQRENSGPLTVVSDARGRFRIVNALPGRYTLRAHVPGGFAAWENGREVTVEANKQLTNLDFTLPPFKRGHWKTYTHENGLAGDNVFCVFQSADGALWFGTDLGVSRFDGRTFASLPAEDTLPGGRVLAMTEDDAGRMWMGGTTGVFCYDPKTPLQRARLYTTKDGLPADNVNELAIDKAGRLWVGTSKGLCYYDPAAEQSGRVAFVNTRTEKLQMAKDLSPGSRQGSPTDRRAECRGARDS